MKISPCDELYLNRLRGACILRVVLGHLGLVWFFPPYSEFVMGSLPILFFVSGAVSYFSFLRARSEWSFFLRRLIAISFTYYLLAAILLIIAVFSGKAVNLNFTDYIGWLTIAPTPKSMPFPIGQVWFIHAMVIITLLSMPVFILAERYPWIWFAPIFVSLLLACVQLFYPIYQQFFLLGHNTYQGTACLGFYCLGASLFRNRLQITQGFYSIMLVVTFCVAVFTVWYFDLEIGLASHTYSPDLYYVAVGYFYIFGALFLQKPLERILGWLPLFDRYLLFVSKHAFSIFLIHSFWIIASERHLGLINVADDPARAAMKVTLVVFLSSISAIPLTWLSDKLSRPIKKRLAKG